VQRPFFPEGPDVCHVYVLHPPGGIVGGDRLRVTADVDAGAHALLTTPAATKVYRTAGPRALVENRLRAAGGGVVEWLPQETILFDGCDVVLDTRVDLAPGAAFLGLDVVCFGLPARREDGGFARGRARVGFEVWRDGAPVVVERGRFDGDAPTHAAAWGLGGAPVMGTLLAAPAEPRDLAPLVAELREVDELAVTTVGRGGVVACRAVGTSAERVGKVLRAAWALARRALLNRDAVAPRIWAT
jgi:urease accessory protein